ncbi:conserved hypothetical protein [Xenorhabdus nematophila F1]|nr:conserved hypothetical protein [Xenorhabdus nematophila F1]
MNVKVLLHVVDNLLRVVPAVVDVDYSSDQLVFNVHHLAMLLSHGVPPHK